MHFGVLLEVILGGFLMLSESTLGMLGDTGKCWGILGNGGGMLGNAGEC